MTTRWTTNTPANYRRRVRGSVKFSTYYKVQTYDFVTMTWRDVQRRYPTESEALANFMPGYKCRVMEVTERGRRPLP